MDRLEMLKKVKQNSTKFIVLTGGVCSSIGKGVLISSLGVLLKEAGYSLSVIKWDPYLNVDPGTMSPLVHGEVFVTSDGAETDLDLGHYERSIGLHLTSESSVSSGQIYQEVLKGEREGRFLGKCIQLIPHVVNIIKERLLKFAVDHKEEFILLEIGGTVGDMEGEVFLEAVRQIRMELGSEQIMHAHLSYVPYLSWSGEVKTKPTQHSVIELKRAGLTPDCLFLRTDCKLEEETFEKVSVMCGIKRDFVFQVLSFNPIYRIFSDLNGQSVSSKIQEYFQITKVRKPNLSSWEEFIKRIESSKKTVSIGLVAKYVGSNDPYISVVEAIKSAGYQANHLVDLVVIDAEQLGKSVYGSDSAEWKKLKELDGIIVPGGFDNRGIDGKIFAARWARENDVPYFGLCLGMQVMVIEAARSLLNLKKANSSEFDSNSPDLVIDLMEEQRDVKEKGASMRLGAYPCTLKKGTKAYEAYKQDVVLERHRHRYEVNNVYIPDFEKAGMVFSGFYKDKNLVEIAELKDHSFMIGTQFHPEFHSSPLKVHPLFKAFMDVVVAKKDK